MKCSQIFCLAAVLTLTLTAASCSKNKDANVDALGANDIIAPPSTFGDGSGTGLGTDGSAAGNFDEQDQSAWGNNINENDPNTWERLNDPNIQFPVIYFAYDSDVLGNNAVEQLTEVANYLKLEGCASIGVIIEAHSDERGTEEYNRSLSERRALSVKNFMVSQGVAENRFHTIGYGEERPAVSGSGESAWMKNRRAELVPARMK